jgi:hypothetical protein
VGKEMRENNELQKLSKEDVTQIRQASAAKKMRIRTLHGFKSLRRNPAKLIAILVYLAAVSYLFINAEPLIIDQIARGSIIYTMIFKTALAAMSIVFFMWIIMLFGTNFWWPGKLERAFISAGLYTRARKAPFLIACYKDKETKMRVFEVYLNGITKDEIEAKRESIESELELRIRIEPKGTSRILLYTSPDTIKPKKRNRDDLNF